MQRLVKYYTASRPFFLWFKRLYAQAGGVWVYGLGRAAAWARYARHLKARASRRRQAFQGPG
jgi:hypothetical protein